MEPGGENGIFMKIIRREAPAEIVYEDEETMAFLAVGGNVAGHTLVVPKKPYRNVFAIDEASWQAVMHTVRKIAPSVRDAVGAKGVHINSNHEPEAGQEVFHFHVHIIPRHERSEFEFCWPHHAYADGEASAIAAAIRAHLGPTRS